MSRLLEEFGASWGSIDNETRKDVLERRTERVSELRAKLECYQGILGGFATSISKEIEDAEQMLIRKMIERISLPDDGVSTEESDAESVDELVESAV